MFTERVKNKAEKGRTSFDESSRIKWHQKIGIGDDRDFFIENLSQLLACNMGILEALESLRRDVKTTGMKFVIDEMIEKIKSGNPLWRTMEAANIFPLHLVSLVKIGEQSGKLVDNLRIVAKNQVKQRFFRSKIRSAMMYPTLVLVVSFLVGIGVSWFVLPKLTTVFISLKMDLPLSTELLITFGLFMKEWGYVAAPAGIVSFFGIIFFVFFYSKTRFIGQTLIFKTPLAGKLIQETEMARFGAILSSLLQSGLTLVGAIDSLSNSTDFYSYRAIYDKLKTEIENGNSFEGTFRKIDKIDKWIPFSVQQLVITGEKSGSLAYSLEKIGEIFEERIEIRAKNLGVILEPILLIVVWVGVSFVAFSVILPVYSLIGQLNANSGRGAEGTPKVVLQVDSVNEESKESVDLNEEEVAMEDANSAVEEEVFVEILDTPTGFLNARNNPSLKNSEVVDQVRPGDVYKFIADSDDGEWKQLLVNEELVWVFAKYVSISKKEEGEVATQIKKDEIQKNDSSDKIQSIQ